MSAVEKLAEYQDEMMQEVQRVQDLMAQSPTGQRMMETSIAMAGTEAMNNLMALIGDQSIREEERMLLAQYMGEMLKRDAARGMLMFSEYLKSVAANPQYAARREYYLSVGDAAQAVHNTPEYQAYIVAYAQFERDTTPQAAAARKATEEMQEKMKKWAEA